MTYMTHEQALDKAMTIDRAVGYAYRKAMGDEIRADLDCANDSQLGRLVRECYEADGDIEAVRGMVAEQIRGAKPGWIWKVRVGDLLENLDYYPTARLGL